MSVYVVVWARSEPGPESLPLEPSSSPGPTISIPRADIPSVVFQNLPPLSPLGADSGGAIELL